MTILDGELIGTEDSPVAIASRQGFFDGERWHLFARSGNYPPFPVRDENENRRLCEVYLRSHPDD